MNHQTIQTIKTLKGCLTRLSSYLLFLRNAGRRNCTEWPKWLYLVLKLVQFNQSHQNCKVAIENLVGILKHSGNNNLDATYSNIVNEVERLENVLRVTQSANFSFPKFVLFFGELTVVNVKPAST